MKQRLTAIAAAVSIFGAAAAAPPAVAPSVAIASAKSCSSGWVKAKIDGSTKCLKRGQFCKRSADRQYRKYGFRCTKYDARVSRYRLT